MVLDYNIDAFHNYARHADLITSNDARPTIEFFYALICFKHCNLLGSLHGLYSLKRVVTVENERER